MSHSVVSRNAAAWPPGFVLSSIFRARIAAWDRKQASERRPRKLSASYAEGFQDRHDSRSMPASTLARRFDTLSAGLGAFRALRISRVAGAIRLYSTGGLVSDLPPLKARPRKSRVVAGMRKTARPPPNNQHCGR